MRSVLVGRESALATLHGAWHDARLWSRLDLPAGAIVAAPAIVEQPDATIFIEPGLRGRVDALGNMIVERA